ncbi:hypothetical protein WH47_00547 [Habropoda laboriosa]|uniref:Uncharacterized protein n=1 Tax=Habropoda laboriosa TaxID=597456 RepID=A0A0L7R3X3_9HYME|nr:hypothetical protein WH47_00547 [Habropoda laboriosa]
MASGRFPGHAFVGTLLEYQVSLPLPVAASPRYAAGMSLLEPGYAAEKTTSTVCSLRPLGHEANPRCPFGPFTRTTQTILDLSRPDDDDDGDGDTENWKIPGRIVAAVHVTLIHRDHKRYSGSLHGVLLARAAKECEKEEEEEEVVNVEESGRREGVQFGYMRPFELTRKKKGSIDWHAVILRIEASKEPRGRSDRPLLAPHTVSSSLVSRYENITHEQWPRESLEPNE